MKRVLSVCAVIASAAALGACATVTRTPQTAWEINSSPQGAQVMTTNGYSCISTPCTLQMPRRSTFTATLTQRGYKPAQVSVANHLSAQGAIAFLGNGLIGGIPGAALDIYTGSMLDLDHNGETIVLAKDASYTSVLYGYTPQSGFADDVLAPGETVTLSRF